MVRFIPTVTAVAGVLAWALLPCRAHDLVAPPWRGVAGGTYQEWRFSTSANPAAPEVSNNPYGAPTASISVGPYGSGWLSQLPGLGTQYGYWDMGSAGVITVMLPNKPNPPAASSKWVAVQVTYFLDITQAPTVVVAGGTRVTGQTRLVESVPTGGDWKLDQSYWRITPSPTSEVVTITSSSQWGAVIDQVVIDTVSTQSAGSVAAAKRCADGSAVELGGPVVTRVFEDYFYIEDANRIAGIRVNCGASQLPQQGTRPSVLGRITTIDGERVIDQAVVFPGGGAQIPRPLGMQNPAVFVGLNPQGLHVALWGRARVAPGATTFTITDGAVPPAQPVEPVRVELHGVSAPPDGSYVCVTGVLGADLDGPILRVNSSDSVRSYP